MSAGRNINSLSQDWCTPPKYVKAINDMFGRVDLDPCSNDESLIQSVAKFKLPEKDGLAEDWYYQNIYVNPPYGRNKENKTSIKDWFKKIYETYLKYSVGEIVALVPVATNTSHWKDYVWGKATAICFLYDTRLKFLINGSTNNKGAPMACCMIYWGYHKYNEFYRVFKNFGAIVKL